MTDLLASVPAPILADLRARYGEPQRWYHTWAHVEALLRWFEDRRADWRRPRAVLAAILFHDAIYDPTRGDNEALSAELLRGADWPDLAPADRAFAIRLIEATAKHGLPDDLPPDETADAALFLDMDLSILGARDEVFDGYEAQVRAEYAHVPDDLFIPGRRRILAGFADRPTLYFSDWGRERFEGAARANITRSQTKAHWGEPRR